MFGIIFFRNALNFDIGGDRTEHVIWRVNNLSFPASIKYIIIHCGANNIKFNNPIDMANGISNGSLVLVFFPDAKNFRVFVK